MWNTQDTGQSSKARSGCHLLQVRGRSEDQQSYTYLGSYWKEGRWGYKCCHSFFKYYYCTVEAGNETANSEECIINDATGEESVKKPSNPHGDASGKTKRGEKEEEKRH